MWKEDVDVKIQDYSWWLINAWVVEEDTKQNWLFTGFYGHPDTSKRRLSSNLFGRLNPLDQVSWCVVGDFNEVLAQSKKLGEKKRGENQMCKFREAVEINGLCDLGYRGDKFTWRNEHSGDTVTKERLDRFVAKNSWRDVFQEVWVEVLPARCLDHKPLVLNMQTIHTRYEDRRKLFLFEACWINDKNCEEDSKFTKGMWCNTNWVE